MKQIKEKWASLALREQQFVLVGGICAAIFIGYLLIWAPLADKIISLRSSIIHNQNLLVWMQDSDAKIQFLEKTIKQQNTQGMGSLLGVVQNQLNQNPVGKFVTELHQADNNTVQIHFQKIDFDKLMAWVVQLWEQHGLLITDMSVSPSGTLGIVSVELSVGRVLT